MREWNECGKKRQEAMQTTYADVCLCEEEFESRRSKQSKRACVVLCAVCPYTSRLFTLHSSFFILHFPFSYFLKVQLS